PADAAEYASAVAGSLADALRDRGLAREGMLLEAEPGRAVYADAGLHLATVTNVKRQRDPDPRCWIETDTSEVFLMDTTLEHALFPVVSAERADAEPTLLADVTGISCNFDVIAPAVAARRWHRAKSLRSWRRAPTRRRRPRISTACPARRPCLFAARRQRW